MSYHRVLPRPTPLSNEVLANRWAVGADSLKSARIMTDERSTSAYIKNGQIPTRSPANPALRKSPVTTPELEDRDGPSSSEHRDSTPEHENQDSVSARRRTTAPSSIDTWQGETPSQICLCQPDPKVPRPRNAFILYRQHHQASIVAQHPGLPNPEISKVIGDHWRASPPEVKEHWKLLAEEEKVRHQKQYPDYRYQPRRSTRTGSLAELQQSGNPSVSEHSRCAKCGGKSMGTSISTQGSHGEARSNRDANHGMAPPPTTVTVGTGRLLRGLASPPDKDVTMHNYRFARPQTAHVLPLSSPRHAKRAPDTEKSPGSPEPKRRRIPTVSFAQSRGSQGPQTPFPIPPQQRRPSLSRPDGLGGTLPSPIMMGFPSRLSSGKLQQRSESLKLPPLHTPSTPALHNRTESNDTQKSKTLDAMVNSIPLLNKIRVLGRISAPLPIETRLSPSTSSFKRRGRGAIIAIDSADSIAVKQIVDTLERSLKGDHNLKTFSTPKFSERRAPTIQSYLRMIDQYHDLNGEVLNHVSNLVGTENDSARTPSVAHQLSAVELNAEDADAMDVISESPLSPKSQPNPQDGNRKVSISLHGQVEVVKSTSKASEVQKIFPIALLPAWQLTQTDFFATNVPIADSYSAMDHWQWHATLWRGVLGADVTIAVQNVVIDDHHSPSETAISRTGGVGSASGADHNKGTAKAAAGGKGDRSSAANGVDVRIEDYGAVVLQPGEKGAIAEGALRRLGFEISEWVRAWYEREGA